jgi:threonine synthase
MPPEPTIHAAQRCMHPDCGAEYGVERVLTSCPACHDAGRGESLLDVVYDYDAMRAVTGGTFDYFRRPASGAECSGVWQFRELLPFYAGTSDIASVGEGKTILQKADALARELGFGPNLYLQYEGMNPSGSFKDNGMTAGFTHARMVGARVVACASTGNTSASLALYAAQTGMRAYVFIGDGKIAFGKLSQALDYGAVTLQIAGDFDACLARVREIAERPGPDGKSAVYLLNSVNPFRLEGQKTIMCRVLRDLGFGLGGAGGLKPLPEGGVGVGSDRHQSSPSAHHSAPSPSSGRAPDEWGPLPDWIVVPGGNLGNCSAFAKAFIELHALGMIPRIPRLAVINAHGARTLDRLYNELNVRWTPASPPRSGTPSLRHRVTSALSGSWDRAACDRELARMDAAREKAHTIASAIEINRPVNLPKALRALHAMNGVVRSVDDRTILEHKALVGRYGYGCEPASAASVAGARLLREQGVIAPHETVVCILTGHQLKDPDATVTYHTGIDTKAAQADIDARHKRTPDGRWSNQPVRVADDVGSILRAMGL